jgi:rRNA maturation endonuclease Nob1
MCPRTLQVDVSTAKRLCLRCKECPGFQFHAIKQNICRECGHSAIHHKVVVEEEISYPDIESSASMPDS